jgi:hypothetical protein
MTMSEARLSLIAYLSTVGAIVVMTLAAAAICVMVNPDNHLPQIVAALGFIGAAVTGLIGVIGTFRPKEQNSAASVGTADSVTVNPTNPPAAPVAPANTENPQ